MELDSRPRIPATLCFRYNRKCMEFLQTQMTQAEEAASPYRCPNTLELDSTSGDDEKIVSCRKAFDEAWNLGVRLTSLHSKAFDTEKFYSATEAWGGALTICKSLKSCLETWNVQGVEIPDRVPEGALEEDERSLDRYLGYILGTEARPSVDGMPPDVQVEWEQAKQKQQDRLKRLRIVPDSEIGDPQHQLSESVYVATYRFRSFAVKSGKRLNNVGFARFYTEAAVMEDIRSQGAARLFALTRSGKLVMEKGEMDIMAWFCKHKHEGLKLKLRLLRDAARSLNEVHGEKFVHRDIRTKKFVVFGGGPNPDVKIVGFGKASTMNITWQKTLRTHFSNLAFAAPEIFEAKPCDKKSDMYSFGIVMYEMIGECTPYGTVTSEKDILSMKKNGEAPLPISSDRCPDDLLQLMKECCAIDPASRPLSMQEVHQRLTVFANLDDPQVASLSKLHAIVDEIGEMLLEIRYNAKTLTFLHSCLTEAKNVQQFPEDPYTFQAWNELAKAVQRGKKLVQRHTQEFELSNYYTIGEALYLVNEYSSCVVSSAQKLGVCSSARAQNTVPDDHVQSDKVFMEQHLRYVVGVLDRDDVDDDRYMDEWLVVKSQLKEKVQGVEYISVADVNWKEKDVIARGGQGTVYRATWNGTKVALKVLGKSRSPDCNHDQLAAFWAETAASAKMEKENPHIARVLAMGSDGHSNGAESTLFLVMELADENLESWYKVQDTENWPLTRNVLFQAAKGLQLLHKGGMVHRDVKPQNILVFHGHDGARPIIKLCDLGVATGQSVDWRKQSTLRGQPGTIPYQAPELFDGKRSSVETDVFSFGVVMIEVVARCEPLGYMGDAALGRKCDGKLPCAIPNACPQDLKDLIKKCLSPDSHARPSMEKVVVVLEAGVDKA